MDFTLRIYRHLVEAVLEHGYHFISFEQYCQYPKHQLPDRFIIMRHDVDSKADASLLTAQLENQLGVIASYYFRVSPQSNKPLIIKQIVGLGHEIGYHYEDLSVANGNVKDAIHHFSEKLCYFRQFYPVRTICMHGAPTSKYDGRDLWKQYDYHQFDIIGEPYYDVDFSEVFYLTDTGRCWDGYKVSLRDKIPEYQDLWIKQGLSYHSTSSIIKAIREDRFPQRVMITTHPQRWTDNLLSWSMELIMQTIKNIVKRIIIIKRNR